MTNRSNIWSTTAWVAAILVTGLIAGCGSDDQSADADGSITTSSLSLAEYRKQAKAICARSSEEETEEMSTYAAEHPDESEEELYQGAAEEVFAPKIEERVDALGDLGAPAGDEKQVKAFLVALQRVGESAVEDGAASSKFVKASDRARRLARSYKLGECDL
jgi:hypothetical protein